MYQVHSLYSPYKMVDPVCWSASSKEVELGAWFIQQINELLRSLVYKSILS